MSVFDKRMIEIAAQRGAPFGPEVEQKQGAVLFDESGNEIDAGSNGFGHAMGVVMIVIGAVFLVYLTYGLAVLFFIGALFAFGGEKITDTTLRAGHAAAAQRDPDSVDKVYAGGFCALIVYILVGAAVLFGAFAALAGAGMIAGVGR